MEKAPEIDLEEIVANIRTGGESLESFYGVMEMTSSLEDFSEAQEFSVWFHRDGRYRMESVMENVGTFINVFDGSTLWMYTGDNNSALKMDMDVEAALDDNNLTLDMFSFISEPDALFSFSYRGTAVISGRNTYVLDVEPKDMDDELAFTMTWWIDQETWFPVRYELMVEDVSFSATYSTFEINPTLPLDTFTFDPPEGAEIMDMSSLLEDFAFDLDPNDLDLDDFDFSQWPELEGLMRELEGWPED